MRNLYMFEPALQVGSVQALEFGINNINEIHVNRDSSRDNFYLTETFWECDTTQGLMYELSYSIISPELQRLVPSLFRSFKSHNASYSQVEEMDIDFPEDCNAFLGFEFENTAVQARAISCLEAYRDFVNSCLKFGHVTDRNELQYNLATLFPKFRFENRALDDMLVWKQTESNVYSKVLTLLEDIPVHPFTGGIGQTEVLRNMDGCSSKRITQAHRLVYHYADHETVIVACSGHYE